MNKRSKKPLTKKTKTKMRLDKAMRQFCKVQIDTSKPEGDYEDVTLTIKFLNGMLKDEVYTLNIDRSDYHEVW